MTNLKLVSLIVVAVKSASCFKRKDEDEVLSTVDSFTISRWSCLCNWWGNSDPLRWTEDDNKFTTDSVKVLRKSFCYPQMEQHMSMPKRFSQINYYLTIAALFMAMFHLCLLRND